MDNKGINKNSAYYGHVAIGVLGATIIGITSLAFPFIIVPAMRKRGGVPWMVTPSCIINKALSHLIQMRSPQQSNKIPRLIDLGSGDGRVCIQAAKQGFHSVGYEVSILKILL